MAANAGLAAQGVISMSTLVIPNGGGVWSRLRNLWAMSAHSEQASAAPGNLPARVAELERQVKVLEAQVSYGQNQFNQLQTRFNLLVQPHAVLPTDVFIAGKRYTAEGAAYITTAVSGTDGFSAGARVTATGEQVVV